MRNILEKLDQWLNTALKIIVVIIFACMVSLIIAQVYTRFFTTRSLTWSEELSRYFLAYLIFFSAILITRQKRHLRIDNVVNILPAVPAKVVNIIALLLQILFYFLVIWGAAKLFPTASMRLSPANSIPMNFVYFCVPVFCAFSILYTIRDIVEEFAGKGEKP